MKIHVLGQGKEMIEVTEREAFNQAGAYSSDADLERDCKLMSWIGKRKHRCIEFDVVTYSAQLERAVADGIEVLITKDKT
jgi:hypothetical protein